MLLRLSRFESNDPVGTKIGKKMTWKNDSENTILALFDYIDPVNATYIMAF